MGDLNTFLRTKANTIPQPKTPSPWADFRALCRYYAACVTAAEHPTEYLPLKEERDQFVVLHPPVGWLGDKSFRITLDKRRDLLFLSRMASRAQFDETLYVGYPCEVIQGKGTGDRFAVPLFAIPVEARETEDGWAIEPDYEAAQINQQWLKYNVPKEEHKRILTLFHKADGTPDFAIACAYLEKRTGRPFDPALPEAALPRTVGMANAAVLAVGMRLKYSKTLRRELLQIAEAADEVLDRTALAYVFRNPPRPNEPATPERLPYPADFLRANTEQRRALIEALAHPCTKIQGPPGTGKSQAAVNLLLNLAYRGQSALFASRNHAAIHAIEEKVKAAFAADPMLADVARDWVQQCASDDGGTVRTWMTADPEAIQAAALRILDAYSAAALDSAVDTFEADLEDLALHWQTLERRTHLKHALEAAEEKAQSLRERLRVPEATDADRLAKQAQNLAYAPRTPFARLLWWLVRGARRQGRLERTLREAYPNITAPSRDLLRERLAKQAGLLRALHDTGATLRPLQAEASALPPYDPTFAAWETAGKRAAKTQSRALLAQLCRRTADFPPDAIQRIAQLCRRHRRLALPFLATTAQPLLHQAIAEAFADLTRLYPIWVCTLLSLTKASPCNAALFDRVVIDEAAQCDVPPLIPALFRAKAVTVIGDDKQFPPVIDLPEARHAQILRHHHLEDTRFARFDYLRASAYSVVPTPPRLLVEHFRCAPDIAAYCSEAFYDGRLVIQTEAHEDPSPYACSLGHKADLDWLDVRGTWDDEAAALERQLGLLADNLATLPATPSIGVITPFRSFADGLRERLHPLQKRLGGALDPDHVNTVNAFQGGECDLIFLLLGLNAGTTHGQLWYATDTRHAYIYNVAVSRARVGCFIIGDRARAQASPSPFLSKLAAPHPHRKPPTAPKTGPGERLLADALRRLGLDPKPQYPCGRRWLDLALLDSKIDIEVDGRTYHLNSRGERNQDDYARDAEVASRGWLPYRVWHHKVTRDPDAIAHAILALHRARLAP